VNSPVVETIDAARIFYRGGRSVEALRAASCRVFLGERIAILGPSGSGKSTLLHLLGGLDQPTSGRVAWPELGTSVNLRPKLIAVVPQSPSLVPWLSTVENVELPVLLGGEARTARDQAMASLEHLGLASLADRLPQELSGGQAQRVAIARALIGDCKLILADEPTGQIDGATAATLFDALLTHLASRDAALVVTTHDPAVAARMGKAWRIDHGLLDTAPATGR
jgi:putative ABC transport system ATP-binding protein/lipoprotein-releasing system ATP-binding protein